jgi:hypothetical protein
MSSSFLRYMRKRRTLEHGNIIFVYNMIHGSVQMKLVDFQGVRLDGS